MGHGPPLADPGAESGAREVDLCSGGVRFWLAAGALPPRAPPGGWQAWHSPRGWQGCDVFQLASPRLKGEGPNGLRACVMMMMMMMMIDDDDDELSGVRFRVGSSEGGG